MKICRRSIPIVVISLILLMLPVGAFASPDAAMHEGFDTLLPFDIKWGMNADAVTGKLPNQKYYFLDSATDRLSVLHYDAYDENASGVRDGYKYIFMFIDGKLRKINTMIYAGGESADSELQQYLLGRFGDHYSELDEADLNATNLRQNEFGLGEEPYTKEELEEEMPAAKTWDLEDTVVWANWIWQPGNKTEMSNISYHDRNWFYGGNDESDLNAVAQRYGNIVLWHYADYDGDGTGEAFFAVGQKDNWGETELDGVYFINGSGNVQLMNKYDGTLYENASGCARQCGGKSFFWGSYGYGGPGTWSFVYSVKNGVPYELPLMKALYTNQEGYSGFYENNGTFYVFKDGYLPEGGHDGRNYELIYDADAQDFRLGKEITETPETEMDLQKISEYLKGEQTEIPISGISERDAVYQQDSDKYIINRDINHDGKPESIEISFAASDEYNTINYAITSGDGKSTVRSGMSRYLHSEVGSWGNIQIRMGAVGNGYLYVAMNIAEQCGYYRVYQLVNNQIVLVEELENPGYSSGEGLYYCTDGEYDYDRPVFYDNDDDDHGEDPGMVAALNDVLNKYGAYFSQGEHPYLANLDAGSLICDYNESDFTGGQAVLVIPQPEPDPTAPATVSSNYVYMVKDANVRTGAGTDYKSIGTVYNGTNLPYLNEKRNDARPVTWYKVNFYGMEGWVSSALSELRSGSGQTLSTSSPVKPVVTDPVKPVATTPPASKNQIVTTGKVNIRSGPGKGYSRIGDLANGARAEYLGEAQYDDRNVLWYKIRHNGKTGWVSSTYAKVSGDAGTKIIGKDTQKKSTTGKEKSPSTSTSSGPKVVISGGKTNIRSGPGLDYGKIGDLLNGSTVEYLGKSSTDSRGVVWYYIKHKNKTGWVSSKYAKIK